MTRTYKFVSVARVAFLHAIVQHRVITSKSFIAIVLLIPFYCVEENVWGNWKKPVNISEEGGLFPEKMLTSLQSPCSHFYSHPNRTARSAPKQRSKGRVGNGKQV